MFSGQHNEYFTHPDGRKCLSLKDGSWVYKTAPHVFTDCELRHWPVSKGCDLSGDCNDRPCGCALAAVTGCNCGLYLDQIRRRAGHHFTDCAMILRQRQKENS